MKLTKAQREPGTIRICVMRDAPCPHGLDCPYVGDGPYGYPCKEGYRDPPSRADLDAQEGKG